MLRAARDGLPLDDFLLPPVNELSFGVVFTDEGDLTPPLDLVIGTKWTGARIEWNGTDPIL